MPDLPPVADPAGPQSPAGKPSLQERLAKLAERHGPDAEPPPAPEPDAEPPTEEESLAALSEGFPEAATETVQGND